MTGGDFQDKTLSRMNVRAKQHFRTAQLLSLSEGTPTGILLFFSGALLLLAFSIDMFILEVSPFTEEPPHFTRRAYNLRTILIALSSCLFVVFIARLSLIGGRLNEDDESEALNGSKLGTRSIANLIEPGNTPHWMKKLIVWVVFSVALVFQFIFLTRPELFFKLGREGNLIETLSATFAFIACGLFAYIFLLLCRQALPTKGFYLVTSLSFAGVFFLLGMEEVSWFQRVLSFDTPELFKSNTQGEFNLHNFATNYVENAYYFCSFVFLILLPFINDRTRLLGQNPLSFFVPSRFILLVSAIFVAYNYEMWRILLTQLSFFMTFFILTYYAWLGGRRRENLFVAITGVILYVLTQVSFLAFGGFRLRITEYKEFFIPLDFLLYAFEILRKAQAIRPSR